MNATRALLRRLLCPATAAWEPLTEAVIAAAREEQVLGAFADDEPTVRAARREQAARALALPGQLAELDALLDEPATLLKGGALLPLLYADDPGTRGMADIDLLLAPAAAARLRDKLPARGWVTVAGYENYLYRPGDRRLPLDLHTELVCVDRLTARAALNAAPGVAELLAQRTLLPGYRHLAAFPPLAAGMTMLMHHLLHHGCRGAKWWLDFHRWWQLFPAERGRLLTDAPAAWRAPLAFALWFYARLTGVALPAVMAEIIRAEYRAFWPWYAERILDGSRRAPLRYLAAFAWLPRADWPRYARELALPDRAALRAYYKVDEPAALLYLRHWRGNWRALF